MTVLTIFGWSLNPTAHRSTSSIANGCRSSKGYFTRTGCTQISTSRISRAPKRRMSYHSYSRRANLASSYVTSQRSTPCKFLEAPSLRSSLIIQKPSRRRPSVSIICLRLQLGPRSSSSARHRTIQLQFAPTSTPAPGIRAQANEASVPASPRKVVRRPPSPCRQKSWSE